MHAPTPCRLLCHQLQRFATAAASAAAAAGPDGTDSAAAATCTLASSGKPPTAAARKHARTRQARGACASTRPHMCAAPASAKCASLLSTSSFSTPMSSRILAGGRAFGRQARQAGEAARCSGSGRGEWLCADARLLSPSCAPDGGRADGIATVLVCKAHRAGTERAAGCGCGGALAGAATLAARRRCCCASPRSRQQSWPRWQLRGADRAPGAPGWRLAGSGHHPPRGNVALSSSATLPPPLAR